MRSSCALAGGVDGGDEPLVVDGDFEGVPFFAFGKADEEDGFACAVEGDVLQPGVVTEGGVADGGEGGLELLGSGGEDGRPLAIELGGALVDDCGPSGGGRVFSWLEEKAVLVLVGGAVAVVTI